MSQLQYVKEVKAPAKARLTLNYFLTILAATFCARVFSQEVDNPVMAVKKTVYLNIICYNKLIYFVS